MATREEDREYGRILAVVEQARDAMKELLADAKKNNTALTLVQVSQQAMHEIVTKLDNVVLRGNGDSAVSRLRAIERTLEELAKKCENLQSKVNEHEAERSQFAGGKTAIQHVIDNLKWLVPTCLAIAAWAK